MCHCKFSRVALNSRGKKALERTRFREIYVQSCVLRHRGFVAWRGLLRAFLAQQQQLLSPIHSREDYEGDGNGALEEHHFVCVCCVDELRENLIL